MQNLTTPVHLLNSTNEYNLTPQLPEVSYIFIIIVSIYMDVTVFVSLCLQIT